MKSVSSIQVEKYYYETADTYPCPQKLIVTFNIILSTTPKNQSEFILSGSINIICIFFSSPFKRLDLSHSSQPPWFDYSHHILWNVQTSIWSFVQFCYSIFLSGQHVPSTSLIYTPYAMKYKECRVLVSYSWLKRLYGAENETDGEESVKILSQHSPRRSKETREKLKYVWAVTCWAFEAVASEIFRRSANIFVVLYV
jgi:hypothetical protein